MCVVCVCVCVCVYYMHCTYLATSEMVLAWKENLLVSGVEGAEEVTGVTVV